MAVQAQTVDELKAKQLEAAQSAADATNKTRSGKGTRVRVGQTRGKASQVISWEAFDESLPDTLPGTLTEFMDVTNVKDEKEIVSFLISGYNDAQYTAASDPIAEFVDPAWPDEITAAFRLVVRNMYKTLSVLGNSLEDVVNQVKPGFVAAAAKK